MNQGDVSFHPLLTILQTEDIVRHLVDFQVLFVSFKFNVAHAGGWHLGYFSLNEQFKTSYETVI